MRIDKQARKYLNKIEKRIKHPNKTISKQCIVCGSGIVKDFIDVEYDFICQECLNDMKELTTDFDEPFPKWIVMNPEVIRKTLILKHFKHDFPDKYEKLKNDFTKDYPVQEYTRKSGTVKAHERESQIKLNEIIEHSKDDLDRVKAIKKSNNLELLENIATSEENPALRNIAFERIESLASSNTKARKILHSLNKWKITKLEKQKREKTLEEQTPKWKQQPTWSSRPTPTPRDKETIKYRKFVKKIIESEHGLTSKQKEKRFTTLIKDYKDDFQDFDNNLVMKTYRELKLEHPEWKERLLLKEVFKTISKEEVLCDRCQTKKGFKMIASHKTLGYLCDDCFKKFKTSPEAKNMKIKLIKDKGKRIQKVV